MERGEPNFEQLLTEQEVIAVLDAHEPGAPEAVEIMGRYVDQCHDEAQRRYAEGPETGILSLRVNLEADILVATVCAKSTHYKGYARDLIESPEGLLYMAKRQESTRDLAEQVESLLASL